MTERAGALLQQASQLAASRLIELMHGEEVPVQIQYAAAVKVLDFAYRGEERIDLQSAVEELKSMHARAVRSLLVRGRAGKVIVDRGNRRHGRQQEACDHGRVRQAVPAEAFGIAELNYVL